MNKPNVSLRAAQKELTRTRIREAARVLFRDRGFWDVSMEDVAVRAGAARTTIYFHYPTKTELMADLLQDDWEKQLKLVRKLVETPVIDRTTIATWLERLVSGVQGKLDSLAMHAFTVSQDEKFSRQQFEHRERQAAILGERIPAFRRAETEPDDVRAWTASYLMIVQIETFAILAARDLKQDQIDDALAVMVDVLCAFAGIEAAAGEASIAPRQAAAG